MGQYKAGSLVRPNEEARGDEGSQAATAMMAKVVNVKGQLARLWKKGIFLVRMTWMISV